MESEILERGVDFSISRNNKTFFGKKEKKFIVYPLCLGTMLKISELINSIENIKETIESENLVEIAIKQIENETEKIVKIIALAIWNKKISKNPIIRLYQNMRLKILENFLFKNLTSLEMNKLVTLIVQQLEVQHFLAVLVSLKGMSLTNDKETAETKGKKK